MKETRFGVFLNRFGHTSSKFGGVLVKQVERDNELSVHVSP
jgi:hypothetical protein